MHASALSTNVLQWAGSYGIPLIVFILVFCAVLVVSRVLSRGLIWKAGRPNGRNPARVVVRAGVPARGDRPVTPNIADPKEQLEAVSRVGFETRKLLNREEVPVLRLLEQIAREANAGHRVMAQTSLGEIIRPKPNSGTEQERQLAFRSINSKRIDFGVFDRFGRLVLAVEYQGSGHYHQTSFMRDAVKQEALRKAGVQVIAIEEGFRVAEVLPRLRRALGIASASEPQERTAAAAERPAA